MSGLNQIQFGFENSLKFGFEKFEKRKREREFSSSGRNLPAAQCSACSGGPSFPRQRPLPDSLGRAQAAACRPNSRALLHRVADMWDPPVSDVSPFLSSSSGFAPPSSLSLRFGESNPPQIFVLSMYTDASGL
jgi:hypothetical protein